MSYMPICLWDVLYKPFFWGEWINEAQLSVSKHLHFQDIFLFCVINPSSFLSTGEVGMKRWGSDTTWCLWVPISVQPQTQSFQILLVAQTLWGYQNWGPGPHSVPRKFLLAPQQLSGVRAKGCLCWVEAVKKQPTCSFQSLILTASPTQPHPGRVSRRGEHHPQSIYSSPSAGWRTRKFL